VPAGPWVPNTDCSRARVERTLPLARGRYPSISARLGSPRAHPRQSCYKVSVCLSRNPFPKHKHTGSCAPILDAAGPARSARSGHRSAPTAPVAFHEAFPRSLGAILESRPDARFRPNRRVGVMLGSRRHSGPNRAPGGAGAKVAQKCRQVRGCLIRTARGPEWSAPCLWRVADIQVFRRALGHRVRTPSMGSSRGPIKVAQKSSWSSYLLVPRTLEPKYSPLCYWGRSEFRVFGASLWTW
jgi:hypothetical protein